MESTIRIDIVSAEQAIFSGVAKMIYAVGELGALGIGPNHAQLLTILKPGQIRVQLVDGREEVFYTSGGILEVQPYGVTVLADTAVRAADIDEAAAIEAKLKAQRTLSDTKSGIDFTRAAAELARATAQIRAVEILRNLDKL